MIVSHEAPDGPGVAPRWTTSAKSGVGTSAGARSMVWFTIARGIVTEVYYPRVDEAHVRSLRLLIAADADFFADEAHDTRSHVSMLADGVPAYSVTNDCARDRFRARKTILADPERNVLLQDTRFEPLRGDTTDYRVYVHLEPHLKNQGGGNTGWIGEYKGMQALFAQREDYALALSSSAPLTSASCGFVGVNDGRTQIRRHGRLSESYVRAGNGNIALTAEVDLAACDGHFLLALGFGRDPDEAGHAVRASLIGQFKTTSEQFIAGWRDFHRKSRRFGKSKEIVRAYRSSVAVIQTHEDKVRRGAFIASLSIPWGGARGDHDLGGYHVVWPRDLVESAGAMLAAGHDDAARHALRYLMTTQEPEGHWPQNMWLDGRAYWSGDQLDETAFPILLADQLRRARALDGLDAWPMIRRAAGYIARNGPVTAQDRWEEEGGYSTFTLAAEIAALLGAAVFAERAGETHIATYLREIADAWNESIERWTYVRATDIARRVAVDGYYVRLAPPGNPHIQPDALIPLRNQADGPDEVPYAEMVSPDALALVRFGLRDPDDEKIRNTVRAIDALLCTETPNGPVWHRYNRDGYGEHEDGTPYDGTGIGRGWPLLTGERAHFELARGAVDEARRLLDVMCAQRGEGKLWPEQIWDTADIPEHSLYEGCPTGSAMPLCWAHAEFVKVVRSLSEGRVFDMPPHVRQRYVESRRTARVALWRFNNKAREMRVGKTLRVETRCPAIVHWTVDDWRSEHDTTAIDTGLGIWHADLETEAAAEGTTIRFTLYWPDSAKWQGEDFAVCVNAA